MFLPEYVISPAGFFAFRYAGEHPSLLSARGACARPCGECFIVGSRDLGGILPVIWRGSHFLAIFVGSLGISAFYPKRRAPLPAERPRGPRGPLRDPAGRPFLGGICSEYRGNICFPYRELCVSWDFGFLPLQGALCLVSVRATSEGALFWGDLSRIPSGVFVFIWGISVVSWNSGFPPSVGPISC